MRKRKLSLLLCILMVFTLCPPVSFADSAEYVSMTISSTTVTAGDTVTFGLTNNFSRTVSYYLIYVGDDEATVDCDGSQIQYKYTFNKAGDYKVKVEAYGPGEDGEHNEYLGKLKASEKSAYGNYTYDYDYKTIKVAPSKDDLPKITKDLPDSIGRDPNSYSSDELELSLYMPYGSSGTWDLYQRKKDSDKDLKVKSGSVSANYNTVSAYLSKNEEDYGSTYYFVLNISNTSIGMQETLYSNKCRYFLAPEKPYLSVSSSSGSYYSSSFKEEGESVTLTASVTCKSESNLSYQWYRGSSSDISKAKAISGAKGSELTTELVLDSDAKVEYSSILGYSYGPVYYFCKVTNTNDEGSISVSDSCMFKVKKLPISKPQITVTADKESAELGETINLTASGSTSDKGKLTYQWYSGRTAGFESAKKINGATKSAYSEKLPEEKCTMYYYCQVTSSLTDQTATNEAYAVITVKEPSPLKNFENKNTYNNGKFSDVKTDDWFAEGVKDAYELGLVKGVSENSFNPSGTLTLAESITLAARLHSTVNDNAYNFDTSLSPWYKCYEDYCIKYGIIKSGEFSDLSKNATRSEFAIIMARAFPDSALESINSVENDSIPDVDTSQAYASSVYKLYRAGILAGSDTKGTFNPASSITRSEVATLVTRMAKADKRKSVTLKESDNYITVYALDGRYDVIRPYRLEAQQKVGWYLYPDYVDTLANKRYSEGDKEGALVVYETGMETVGSASGYYNYFKSNMEAMRNKWAREINCPLAITSYTVTSNYGYPCAKITFRNLTDKVVNDIDIRFVCYDGYWKQTSDWSGNNGKYEGYLESGFTIKANTTTDVYWTLYWNEKTKYIGNVNLKKVAFTDGTNWKK